MERECERRRGDNELMTQEIITAELITQYLETRDDFDLERFAYRTLREHGWSARLGGTYTDPIQSKLRQYDIRARKEIYKHCDVRLAVECKSLTPEFPLVVSRVPRPGPESYHDIIKSWRRKGLDDLVFSIEQSDPTRLSLYGFSEPVGKSLTQIRWDGKRFVTSDNESFDKWSQALASAAELVAAAAQESAPDETPIFTFVMPVLVVSNSTLWVVDYTDDDVRGVPTQVDEAHYFADRELVVKGRYAPQTYHMRHLHVYTRNGFARMLKNYNSPTGTMGDRTFAFVLGE